MRKGLFIAVLLSFILSSCGLFGPSKEELASTATKEAGVIGTMVADSFQKTQTYYKALTPTATRTPTATPRPTNTPWPTPTPIKGTWNNPYRVGDTATVNVNDYIDFVPGTPATIRTFQLLQVVRGEDARLLAKEKTNWFYSFTEPIEGQEYIAVKGKMAYLQDIDQNSVYEIDAFWSLTLRYQLNGFDTWDANSYTSDPWDKGYLPIEGEGWIFYLIQKGSIPVLFFEPDLMIFEQHGERSAGVYFQLFE
jgi:hypothetical protein